MVQKDITGIGLGHLRRRGKDTVADYLCKYYGFRKVSFADNLKKAVAIIFGMDEGQLYGNLKETRDPRWRFSPREILTYFGDLLRRFVSPDIWIDSMFSDTEYTEDTLFVISDVRYPNEFATLKEYGYVMVEVNGPERESSAKEGDRVVGMQCPRSYASDILEKRVPKYVTQFCRHLESDTSQHISEMALSGTRFDYVLKNNGSFGELYSQVDSVLNELGMYKSILP